VIFHLIQLLGFDKVIIFGALVEQKICKNSLSKLFQILSIPFQISDQSGSVYEILNNRKGCKWEK
jgi:hypothetical protein